MNTYLVTWFYNTQQNYDRIKLFNTDKSFEELKKWIMENEKLPFSGGYMKPRESSITNLTVNI